VARAASSCNAFAIATSSSYHIAQRGCHEVLTYLTCKYHAVFATVSLLSYFPAIFRDQEVDEWSHNECSDASAADGESIRQRTPFVEVEIYHN